MVNNEMFHRALVSQKPEAILGVAQAFEALGGIREANVLYHRIAVRVAFGAAGKYTVADLLDIAAAKDVAMINLANRVREVMTNPEYTTSGTKDAYNALVKRYGQARDRAQKSIDKARGLLHITPLSLTDATAEYEGLLDVLNSHWRENTWSAGDWSIEDVITRVNALGSKGGKDLPTPQPMAPDALQMANAAAHIMDEARKGLQRTTQYLAATAGKALGSAARGAGEGLGISTTTLVLIGVGVLGGLFMLNRLMMPSMIPKVVSKVTHHLPVRPV